MLLQNMFYYCGPALCLFFCPCVYASIDTYEHVCNSHPWGHIDPAQVSPHMNNQTKQPSALSNQ